MLRIRTDISNMYQYLEVESRWTEEGNEEKRKENRNRRTTEFLRQLKEDM